MSISQIPTRLLGILALAAAALAILLVARPLLLSDESPSAPTKGGAASPTVKSPATSSKPAPPARRRLQLLPGLPAPVGRELRRERVVVVSVYSANAASDRNALAQARAGARDVDAGFVALNVLNERKARKFASFVGVGETPTMLVVRRPGKIVNRMDGFVDSAIVAQAAQNAGAGKKRSSK